MLLSLEQDCRIFQDNEVQGRKIQDIVDQYFPGEPASRPTATSSA